MKKIIGDTTSNFREKRSKFIGRLFETGNTNQFDEKRTKIKRKYPDATHHCYAWRINPSQIQEFAQDDGEPNGTAGRPILNQLKSFEVVNAGLVVVRYYGGTNLGKSGLIEAYSRAARWCLRQIRLSPIQLIWKIKIQYPYAEQNTVETLMHQFHLKELDSIYTENVSRTLSCPVKYKNALQNSLTQLQHRHVESEFLEKSYI